MLTFSLVLSMAALLFQSIIIPRISILAFAPFLAINMMKSKLDRALWLSALAGLFVDILSDDPMGLHPLNYTLTTALLFKLKKNFSLDTPLHLSLFTGVISLVSTILQLSLLFLFDRRVPFSGEWIFSDLIGMPVVDAFYGFVWFAAPLALFEYIRKVWVQFWMKKKNLSPTSH